MVPLDGSLYSSTVSMSYAALVAAMFFLMYGASLSASVGLTWNCWTMPGQISPRRIAESTSSARPIEGSSQVRRQTLRKNSTAQISAMPMQDRLGGQHRVVVGVGDAGSSEPDW